MKPYGSIRVVRMWCGMRIMPILRCFDHSERLNYGDLLVGLVHKLSS
jgi:hypothetical protein